MIGVAILICLLVPPADKPLGRLDLEPGDLKPGVVAEYRSVAEKEASVTRIEPKPAFYLGRSSPHPRIPPGPFEVTWSGVLSIKETGPISFSAFVGGEATVTVDGVTVLDGIGKTDTSRVIAKATLKREPGYYIHCEVPLARGRTARCSLVEGEAFAREPLPAWRLGHTQFPEGSRAVLTVLQPLAESLCAIRLARCRKMHSRP